MMPNGTADMMVALAKIDANQQNASVMLATERYSRMTTETHQLAQPLPLPALTFP